jgi:integrative and conjugative element protein (TIGR02256 family)
MRKSLTEVWLSNKEITRMIAEANQFAPKETGGVFMGYRTKDSVVITDMIGAGPEATHELTLYRPDRKYEHAEIARVYERSNRIYSYLGDWHTHPAGLLRLSHKDKIALKAVARCKEARVDQPITAILAGEKDNWRLHVWEYVTSAIPFVTFRAISTCLQIY